MSDNEHHLLGQFIPVHYHFNMLNDKERMQGFKAALAHVVKPGAKVLELGGGTGVLSFFAAQHAEHVWYVERNPELVATARRLLAQNENGDKVELVHADASEYLPPEPVDVVVCEMLHVGLLREKQTEIIEGFKQRYLKKFGAPLPVFVPEACIQAVQPVQQDYDFEGYYAPTYLFQNPVAEHPQTVPLAEPALYQMFTYEDAIPQHCSFADQLQISAAGVLNGVRVITKNLLAILPQQGTSIDWFNQYLVVPLHEPIEVNAGDMLEIRFSYPAGAGLDALADSLQVSLKN